MLFPWKNPTGLFPIDHARRSDFNLRPLSLKYYLNGSVSVIQPSGLGYEMNLWGDYHVKQKPS